MNWCGARWQGARNVSFQSMRKVAMLQQDAQIINKLGLHARASAKLTQLASQYPCEVWLTRNGRRVNAKSIMAVMMLAAAMGTTIAIETEGEREQEAMNAIVALINDC